MRGLVRHGVPTLKALVFLSRVAHAAGVLICWLNDYSFTHGCALLMSITVTMMALSFIVCIKVKGTRADPEHHRG